MLKLNKKTYFTKKEALEVFKTSYAYLKTYKKYGMKSYFFDEVEYYTEEDKKEFESLPHFYVYVLFDSSKKHKYQYEDYSCDYEPFYVGKGKFDRCLSHFSENAKTYNQYKTNKINKLKKEKIEIIIEKPFINLTELDAFKKEEILIKKLGIKLDGGPLTNLTYGGIGGTQMSLESKMKMIASKKEWYKHNVHHLQGKHHSPEAIKKMKEVPRMKWSKEQKENLKNVRCENKNKSQTMYWKCINPEGEEFIVYGLGEFCRNNNLQQAHMFSVAKGRRRHHKNWKCEYYESNG
jgi:hypothetical protein